MDPRRLAQAMLSDPNGGSDDTVLQVLSEWIQEAGGALYSDTPGSDWNQTAVRWARVGFKLANIGYSSDLGVTWGGDGQRVWRRCRPNRMTPPDIRVGGSLDEGAEMAVPFETRGVDVLGERLLPDDTETPGDPEFLVLLCHHHAYNDNAWIWPPSGAVESPIRFAVPNGVFPRRAGGHFADVGELVPVEVMPMVARGWTMSFTSPAVGRSSLGTPGRMNSHAAVTKGAAIVSLRAPDIRVGVLHGRLPFCEWLAHWFEDITNKIKELGVIPAETLPVIKREALGIRDEEVAAEDAEEQAPDTVTLWIEDLNSKRGPEMFERRAQDYQARIDEREAALKPLLEAKGYLDSAREAEKEDLLDGIKAAIEAGVLEAARIESDQIRLLLPAFQFSETETKRWGDTDYLPGVYQLPKTQVVIPHGQPGSSARMFLENGGPHPHPHAGMHVGGRPCWGETADDQDTALAAADATWASSVKDYCEFLQGYLTNYYDRGGYTPLVVIGERVGDLPTYEPSADAEPTPEGGGEGNDGEGEGEGEGEE